VRIEARDVTKRFGAVNALDGVSFDVARGSRVALVGPNGSGKSTLNRVLLGLVAAEGHVRIGGRCPFRERVAVARELAYVPQIAPQLAAPVREVVRAIVRVRDLPASDVERVAAELGLALEPIAGRPFRSLSGGTKQKLLIALALASRASLLVLDEPTGSLDARARERFHERFEALPPETTLVLCSHRLDEIRPLVDQVLLLEEGRVAWTGPAGEFLRRSAVATIEAWPADEGAADWLAARGFRRSAAGLWRITLAHDRKLKLVDALVRELGPRLANLAVRDLEGVETGGADRERAGPAPGRHDAA